MSDCGLLAIAYATSICNGDDVCTIQNASSMKMRAHLVKCGFQESKMSPSLSEVACVEDKISVICHCRMPEKGKMIQCSQCKEWIHQACEKAIPRRAWTEMMFVWYCKSCKQPEKNWSLFELMDIVYASFVYAHLYMPWATCCSVWYLHRNRVNYR